MNTAPRWRTAPPTAADAANTTAALINRVPGDHSTENAICDWVSSCAAHVVLQTMPRWRRRWFTGWTANAYTRVKAPGLRGTYVAEVQLWRFGVIPGPMHILHVKVRPRDARTVEVHVIGQGSPLNATLRVAR